MTILKHRAFLIIPVVLLFITFCSDHGLGPAVEQTGFSGTIVFNGTWPANSGEVRVALFSTKHPTLITDLKAFSDPLELFVPSVEYYVEADPGIYGLVAVVWRSTTQIWNINSPIGIYTNDSGDTLSVTVEDGRLTKNIDFTADFSNSGEK